VIAERVRLDRQGYDSRGKYWGANTQGDRLYSVEVTDNASGDYNETHVRAANVRDAKAKAMASMVHALRGVEPRAAP
jgi:hypothetical protein